MLTGKAFGDCRYPYPDKTFTPLAMAGFIYVYDRLDRLPARRLYWFPSCHCSESLKRKAAPPDGQTA